MGRPTASARTTRTAAVCLCAAFALALFATVSPVWLWQAGLAGQADAQLAELSTGPFVASATSGQVACAASAACYVKQGWNRVSDFNATLCQQPYFDKLGKYGFCNGGVNGTVQTPSQLVAIQGLTVTCTVGLFLSSLMAVCAPTAGGRQLALAAGLMSGTSSASAAAALVTAAVDPWYKSFGTAGVLPLLTSEARCAGERCLYLQESLILRNGPAFWCLLACTVISLFASVAICAVMNRLDSLDEVEGMYGAGSPVPGGPVGFAEPHDVPYDDHTAYYVYSEFKRK